MTQHRSFSPFSLPDAAQVQLQQALAFHQDGRLAEAEPLYRAVLQAMPKHFDAMHMLGFLHSQRGQFEVALELIDEAIAINPNFPDAHLNRGIALDELRRHDEAVASYDRAIQVKPDFSDAFYNRAITLRELRRLDEAIASYERSIQLRPQFPEALMNLGNVLQEKHRYPEALVCYERALTYRPQYVEALVNYSYLQNYLGHFEIALQGIMHALSLAETAETKAAFCYVVKNMVFYTYNQDVESLLMRAVDEPWGRSFELIRPFTSLIKLHPAIHDGLTRAANVWPLSLSASELFVDDNFEALTASKALICLLQNCQSCDFDLEKFLACARYALLQLAMGEDVMGNEALNFFSALAQQCFINDYVFYSHDNEIEQAQRIKIEMENNLMQGLPVAPQTVLSVACYFPLHQMSTQQLLNRVWPESVNRVLIQQIIEPSEEVRLRSSIPRITAIKNEVSVLVRNQYEENPYPRWIKCVPPAEKVSIDDYLNKELSSAKFHPLDKVVDLDILIAGCGTGLQVVDVAGSFSGARVLAVDLSLQSLGYAARKSQELGMTNIDYAQADILELGSIGRSFDVIMSVGVLHHLRNPLQGLQELVKLLRPSGLMKLGFYSELARSQIVEARKLIAQKGYDANAADIRKLRYEMATTEDAEIFASLTSIGDFFGVSECRDLLFHVQEQCFRISSIKKMLESCNLEFLGFQLSPHVTKRYLDRFPEDQARTNLDCWDIFEVENPATFIGMYQFWVQKII